MGRKVESGRSDPLKATVVECIILASRGLKTWPIPKPFLVQMREIGMSHGCIEFQAFFETAIGLGSRLRLQS